MKTCARGVRTRHPEDTRAPERRRVRAGVAALLLGAIVLAGCGGGKAATRGTPPGGSSPGSASSAAATYAGPYPFERDAVRIHLTADSRLNQFEAAAHPLLLCVYHLRDPNGFNQILDEPDGISKLLDCSRFDPAVTNTKKIFIQPGGEVTERLDRPEGAKYVGIVAGYSTLKKEDSVRLYPIPIVKQRVGWSVLRTTMPGKLDIDLSLGPVSIQDLRGRQ